MQSQNTILTPLYLPVFLKTDKFILNQVKRTVSYKSTQGLNGLISSDCIVEPLKKTTGFPKFGFWILLGLVLDKIQPLR